MGAANTARIQAQGSCSAGTLCVAAMYQLRVSSSVLEEMLHQEAKVKDKCSFKEHKTGGSINRGTIRVSGEFPSVTTPLLKDPFLAGHSGKV